MRGSTRSTRTKVASTSRAKAHVRTYFKAVDWDNWCAALEFDDGLVTGPDGKLRLRLGAAGTAKSKAIWVGDATDWEKEVAVYNFFTSKWDDIQTEDLATILKKMREIERHIEVQYQRRLHVEAAQVHPTPTQNPTSIPEPPAPPARQQATMTVGRHPEDD